jgi:hypothetical protein
VLLVFPRIGRQLLDMANHSGAAMVMHEFPMPAIGQYVSWQQLVTLTLCALAASLRP